jgi:hypothetical protein
VKTSIDMANEFTGGVSSIDYLRPEDGDRRPKTTIMLQSQAGMPTEFMVTISVRLDHSRPREQEILDLFDTHDEYLDLTYGISIDLAAEARAFGRDLLRLYHAADGRNTGATKGEQDRSDMIDSLLRFSAKHGSSLFHRIFFGWDPARCSSHAVRYVEQLKEGIRSALERPQILCIRSSAPLVPWAFLYDRPFIDGIGSNKVNAMGFWGFKHEIQQDLECTSKLVTIPSTPSIYRAICLGFDEGTHAAAHSPLAGRPGDHASTVADVGFTLSHFNYDCFYFYGHSNHDEPPTATGSYLQLGDDRLYVATLDSFYNAPVLIPDPVVAFLNGCKTAPLTVWNDETVVGFLCLRSRKRICCIATVGHIPADFAAEFGDCFWRYFLDRRLHLGTSLLRARLHMLSKYGNPLGLLYALFGCADTRVIAKMSIAPVVVS